MIWLIRPRTVPRPARSRWRLASSLGIALAASALSLPSTGCGDAKQARQRALPSSPAPAFETKDLDGDAVSLEALKGEVVLLNTWATWCEPCMRELPVLADLHRSLAPRGFTVIGLNADTRRKLPAVRTAVVRHDLPYPIWLDFEGQAQVAFELNGYPTSILIDREGNVRWRREGVIIENDPNLMQTLEQILAPAAPSAP